MTFLNMVCLTVALARGKDVHDANLKTYLQSDFHEELGQGVLHRVHLARLGVAPEKMQGQGAAKVEV
jgi:hypothetical protein